MTDRAGTNPWIALLASAAAAAPLLACQGEETPPADPVAAECAARRTEAFNPNQTSFHEGFLRWACADSPGVKRHDRGQEYCEYFAIVEVPVPAAAAAPARPFILGRLAPLPRPADAPAPRRGQRDPHQRRARYRTTPFGLSLTPGEVLALERSARRVVGQCIFTSWNEDIFTPLPCQGDCPAVLGAPLAARDFRMKMEVNSTEAAQVLLRECHSAVAARAMPAAEGDATPPARDHVDPFLRGCDLNAALNQTEFRKSDAVLCSAAMRLAECGCAPEGGVRLADLLSPFERRGFPLGTWSSPDELPAGCRHVDVGDGSRTVVACDLTGSEVLGATADVKRLCAEKYAPNVVVYAPVPPGALSCSPASAPGPGASTCGATPWVLAP